ncbi:hypothetical protein [Desulfovibrio porci]|uniref:helix-turn-helix transcriptional regulator n=1 Tax=Desulfovibrio porci TaxID=2605782 RepID=UPI002A81FCA0|nr:hypothetical protein [Desulfovibrio porci]MDY3808625.1 hypothetical protein [Desulfovibrio porci]
MSKHLTVRKGKSLEDIQILLEAGDRLIDEKEFARITGHKRRTIQQRRYLGRDPWYFKLPSGAVRYLFSDVCALVASASKEE